MKPTSKTAQALWLFTLLALAACGQVTHEAPALGPQALILTVTSEADSGPGTLRRAIELANEELSTINFAENVAAITLASELVLDKNLTIVGPAGGSVTLSGGNATRIFSVAEGATVALRNLTIADGDALDGGGVYNAGVLAVVSSTFVGNRADLGGGIFSDVGAILTVTSSTFSGNSATRGGGIINFGALSVTSSTFAENGAVEGGGISNNSFSTLAITNSTFVGNRAEMGGGGAANFGDLTVTYSTFAGNHAGTEGSGVGGGGIANGDTLVLTNSIVALNTSTTTNPDIRGSIASGSANLIGGDPGLALDNGLPKLADNGGPTQTVALSANSPAINAADGASCPATDQRGVARPQGAGCDIGAFERVPDPDPVVVTLEIDERGTVHRTTGEVAVSGMVSCSAPASLELNVALEQRQGRATVTGSQTIRATCNAPWQASVLADAGSFKNGGVAVSVTEVSSDPLNQVTQEVRLSWVR